MYRFLYGIVFLSLLYSCSNNTMNYPQTAKEKVNDNYFGTVVQDPYRWLEEEGSKRTNNWIRSQNSFTQDYLSKIAIRDSIKNRLTELWNFPKQSAPIRKSGKLFFFKNDGLQNQDVLYIQDNEEAQPKVLLDPNIFSVDGTTALTHISISKNGQYLAYSVSEAGSDWQKIHVLNIENAEKMKDEVRWVKFSGISWYKDGFYYSRYDMPIEGNEYTKKNINHRICYHKIGDNCENDKLVFTNKNSPDRFYTAKVTFDEKYLLISEMESTQGNVLYISNLKSKKIFFLQLTNGFDYDYIPIENKDDNIYVLTNYEAPNYKLIKINLNSLEIGKWEDVLSETDDVLKECIIAGNKIVAHYLKDAKSRMLVYSLDGKLEKEIHFPYICTLSQINGQVDSSTIYYSITSYTTPYEIYELNLLSFENKLYCKGKFEFNADNYIIKQEFYESKDKTLIPMFIIHKKGIKLDRNNPTLLYGYGGFNISLTPSFSISRYYWMEQGGVYAVANLRGGGEYGDKWHKSGVKLKKQNVFDDFIAASEYLIKKKYTCSSKLAIQGGSNGGLLVGAVTNQRHDLFQVALPAVGVMDMLRFQKFTIGYAWTEDYGSSDDSIQFKYLYNYSPLHNIAKKTQYPAIMVSTADHDDRVVPAHSFKYIATLQEKNNNTLPLLIRIQTNAGHGVGKPTLMLIDELSDILAFTYHNMGINEW